MSLTLPSAVKRPPDLRSAKSQLPANNREAGETVDQSLRLLFFRAAASVYHSGSLYQMTSAVSSISASAPFGSADTSTQLLAGFDVKYLPYTSLKAAKLPISVMKQVVLIT